MFRILFVCILFFQLSYAGNNLLPGNWHASSRTLNDDTEVIEKEYLNLYDNKNFQIVILVSLKKGLAYVKDLRIEVNGIWENRENILVFIVKSVNVPTAKEVSMISQQSLENLANNFKAKYENDKLHMIKVIKLNNKELTTVSESGRKTIYKR